LTFLPREGHVLAVDVVRIAWGLPLGLAMCAAPSPPPARAIAPATAPVAAAVAPDAGTPAADAATQDAGVTVDLEGVTDVDALVAIGLDASGRGDDAGARRAFDRALAMAGAKGVRPRVVAGSPVISPGGFGWTGPERLEITSHRGVAVLDAPSLRARSFGGWFARPPGAESTRDGRTLAAGPPLKVVNADDGRTLFEEPAGGATPLGFTSDDAFLIWQSSDGSVAALDLDHRTRRSLGAFAPVTDIVFAPHSDAFALTQKSGGVALVDAAGGAITRLASDLSPPPVAFGDGSRLALGTRDGVTLVEIASRARSTLSDPRCRSATALAWSRDGARLASVAGATTLCVWDVAAHRAALVVALPATSGSPPARRATFTPGGAGILVTDSLWEGGEAPTRLLRASDGTLVAALGDRGKPYAIAGDAMLLFGGEQGTARLRPDLHLEHLDFSLGIVPSVSDDGTAVIGYVPHLAVVDLRDGRPPVALPRPHGGIATAPLLSPNARWVAASDGAGGFAVWDARTGVLRGSWLAGGLPLGVAAQKDRLLLVDSSAILTSPGAALRARVWNLQTGAFEGLTDTALPTASLGRTAQTPRFTATLQVDASILVSDRARGTALVTLVAPFQGNVAAAVFPDGTFETFGDAGVLPDYLSCDLGGAVYPFTVCPRDMVRNGQLARALSGHADR
jgi:hypothetical protein